MYCETKLAAVVADLYSRNMHIFVGWGAKMFVHVRVWIFLDCFLIRQQATLFFLMVFFSFVFARNIGCRVAMQDSVNQAGTFYRGWGCCSC